MDSSVFPDRVKNLKIILFLILLFILIRILYLGLPLTISHPHIMAMMRRVIEGNHIFGILSFRLTILKCILFHGRKVILVFCRPFEPHINNAKYKIGATAEIYEYGEQAEGFESGFGFRIKARIRQRIKVIQARRQIDGSVPIFFLWISYMFLYILFFSSE